MKRFIFCILFSLTSICNAASIQATCGEFTGHIAIENSSGQIELNKTTVNGVYHFSYNENVATETFIPNKKLRDI